MGDKEIKSLEELGKATAAAETAADTETPAPAEGEAASQEAATPQSDEPAAPVYVQKLDAQGQIGRAHV